MRYKILEVESQIIDALKANSVLSAVDSQGNYVKVRAHAGELSQQAFTQPEMLQTVISLAPFILVQYMGRNSPTSNDTKTIYLHTLMFRLHVGVKDVWNRSDARTSAYDYLSEIYDTLHGVWLGQSLKSLASNLSRLRGKSITAATNASPIVLTVASHGYETGDKIHVQGVGGLTNANNTTSNPYWTITVADVNSISLDGSTGNAAYTSGGTVISAMTSSELSPQSPFMEAGGQDERITIIMPDLLVYQTDYKISLLA